MNLRVAEGSFHGHGYSQADVSVAGAGIDIRLEIRREHQVNAAVTRSNRPARNPLGPRQDARVHAAVARLDVERIESTGNADMAIARVCFHLAIQVAGFYGTVSRAETYFTFEVLNSNAAVAGVEINRAVQRAGLYRAIAGMHVYRPNDGFGLHGSVAGFDLEVGFAGHADLNVKVPRIMAKGKA